MFREFFYNSFQAADKYCLWISCATGRDYYCNAPPTAQRYFPSHLPELLMCILQMRPRFHGILILPKPGLPQPLYHQLLPFLCQQRCSSGPSLKWFRKDRTNSKNPKSSLSVSSLWSQTSTSNSARDGVGIYVMQSQALTALLWISLNQFGPTL